MKLQAVIKKACGPRRRGRGTSLWSAITGRWGRQHRLSANVTSESDWEVEVPQIRMSRAFAVMLVLHVVAVGGLFAFRIWGRDDKAKEKETADSGAPASLVEPVSPREANSMGAPANANPSVSGEPPKTYVWHAGDTLPLVAARFGMTMTALREANPDKELLPGTELVIPRSGRVIGGVDTGDPDSKPAEIYDPSKAEVAAGPPPPRAVMIPEQASEMPDVIPAPGKEDARPVVLKVTTAVPAKPAPAKSGETTAAKKKSVTEKKLATEKKPAPEKKPVAEKKSVAEKKPAPEKAVNSEPASPPARTAGQRAHVVSKGDTVFNVAKRYGLSAEEIAKANGLNGDYHIRMGQQLRIPVKR